MTQRTATATAHPNLALVKYWGTLDAGLNLAANGSISVNLGGLHTRTQVCFDSALQRDELLLDGAAATPDTLQRVTRHLDHVRTLARVDDRARVVSHNSFPAAAGLASSASAYAALSLAATRALDLALSARELSVLARKGSGSACRSIPDGFAEWRAGADDATSYAVPLASPAHWDLRVLSVVVDDQPKAFSSSAGHRAAPSSPLYEARLAAVPAALAQVRSAVLARDFDQLALATEREAVSMHAVAMTSSPAGHPQQSGIYYWLPATLMLIHAVQEWRRHGLAVCFTIDAGANVHLLCEAADAPRVRAAVEQLAGLPPITVFESAPGFGARLDSPIPTHLAA